VIALEPPYRVAPPATIAAAAPFVRPETSTMATTATRLSEEEYRELAMNDPDHHWELWDGVLVEKPPMSATHDNASFLLGFLLQSQLDWDEFRVNVSGGKTRYTARNYFEPDVIVILASYQVSMLGDPGAFNAYLEPLPFVAEVCSPSTGGYDIAAKLPIYQQRGDEEIWFVHPFARTVTVWRRQPDGTYEEAVYQEGIVPVASLPGVAIDLDALLNW
jgi:Uma2 family endonuclease